MYRKFWSSLFGTALSYLEHSPWDVAGRVGNGQGHAIDSCASLRPCSLGRGSSPHGKPVAKQQSKSLLFLAQLNRLPGQTNPALGQKTVDQRTASSRVAGHGVRVELGNEYVPKSFCDSDTGCRRFARHPHLDFLHSLFQRRADSVVFIIPILRRLFPSASLHMLRMIHFGIRKLAHVTEFGVFSVTVFHGIRGGRAGWRLSWALATLAIAATYAGLDEWHQSFVPMREARLRDVLIDISGALLAQSLVWLYARWKWKPTGPDDIPADPFKR